MNDEERGRLLYERAVGPHPEPPPRWVPLVLILICLAMLGLSLCLGS